MAKNEKQTPMMQQYLAIKAQYPDAFLFFRLGDFYELFHQDALDASRILEITLTARNKQADNPIPMCGVPHHSAKDYIRRLVEAGHKVAICEQVEDPKLTKGMVKREVVQVITPGTYFEDDALVGKANQFLASVSRSDQRYLLSFIDVTTGQIRITQTDSLDFTINELRNIAPKEIVLDQQENGDWQDQVKKLVPSFYSYHDRTSVQDLYQWDLKDATDAEKTSLDFLFSYLLSIQKQANQYIQPVERYQISQYLQMNHFTKQQLELTKSIRTQRKKGSLLWLLDQTKTAMGSRLLQKWLDQPLLSASELSDRHDRVEVLVSHYFQRMELVDYLDKIYDLERLVTKIGMGSAGPRDIDQLRNSLKQIPLINQVLSSFSQDRPLFEPLPTFTDLLDLIDQGLVVDPPFSSSEGGLVPDGYSKDLDQYRDAMTNGNRWLIELQAREREITGLKTLKIGYNKVFGYYIEMSRLQASQLEDSRYQRKQTLANNERFVTEELKQLESTLLSAKEKALGFEYAIFVDLRKAIMPYIPQLQALAQEIAQIDVLANFAFLSERDAYVRPQISDKAGDFDLIESRHPVLEKLIGQAAFVPNDIKISPDKPLLLLTGPNMSGKSTYMRQVAYCVILNQIGCFVPAKSARLPIVDKIFTRIGSADDLSSGQSTFMVEMMETNIALTGASHQSLLLFDELGRGTATYDGMALAQAIITHIAHKIKAATIFSTHYHELTALDQSLALLSNIHVGAVEKEGKLIFLHKIIPGPADKSYGIHVAQLAGLPNDLIHYASQVLQDLEGQANTVESSSQAMGDNTQANLDPQMSRPVDSQVIDTLKGADLNHLTPLEAMALLGQLKAQLDQ